MQQATRQRGLGARLIDLHCHLLPGIDDGPTTPEASLAMARRIVADGVLTVAATPHLRADHPEVRPDELAGRVAELGQLLAREGVALEVVVGGEVDIFWAGRASDAELLQVSYGQRGKTVLIETPYGFLSDVFEDLVADVVGRGYRVLLAHPERNPSFQRAPIRVEELAAEGVMLQVNAPSLAPGGPDPDAHRLALHLLQRQLIHVVASDSHSAGPWRPPELSRGYEVLRAQNGEEASWAVQDVPAAVLAGSRIPARPERPPRRFGLRFRRRGA